jgi:hypothetical protein
MNLNIDVENVEQSFDRIAKELINKYELKINDKIYQFIDLEFYFFCDSHEDRFTLEEHIKREGELEAHRYGVDISLGNSKDAYGGVLIRSLLYEDKVIHKSHVKNEIINNLQFGNNNIEIVKKKNVKAANIIRTERENLGKIDVAKNRKEKFKKKKYRFVVFDENVIRKLKGKETLLRKSELSEDEIHKLIGYKLKK